MELLQQLNPVKTGPHRTGLQKFGEQMMDFFVLGQFFATELKSLGHLVNTLSRRCALFQALLKRIRSGFRKHSSFVQFWEVLFGVVSFFIKNFGKVVAYFYDNKVDSRLVTVSRHFEIIRNCLLKKRDIVCFKRKHFSRLRSQLMSSIHSLNLLHFLFERHFDHFELVRDWFDPNSFQLTRVLDFLRQSRDFDRAIIDSVPFQTLNKYFLGLFLLKLTRRPGLLGDCSRNREFLSAVFQNCKNKGYFYQNLVRHETGCEAQLFPTLLFYDRAKKKAKRSVMVGLADEYFALYLNWRRGEVENLFLKKKDFLSDIKVRLTRTSTAAKSRSSSTLCARTMTGTRSRTCSSCARTSF